MANVSILILPRDILFSSDINQVIGFIVRLLKNPDDRIPLFLQYSYINGHAITSEEVELLVQLVKSDLTP